MMTFHYFRALKRVNVTKNKNSHTSLARIKIIIFFSVFVNLIAASGQFEGLVPKRVIFDPYDFSRNWTNRWGQ